VLVYNGSEEADLEALLSALEHDIGAERTPYFKRGAVDLVSLLEVSVINGLLRPAVEDDFKFLVSPFRYPEQFRRDG
jgi:hypothetical protein